MVVSIIYLAPAAASVCSSKAANFPTIDFLIWTILIQMYIQAKRCETLTDTRCPAMIPIEEQSHTVANGWTNFS